VATEIWTEWRCSVVRTASVVRAAVALEAAKVAAMACRGRQLISIRAAAADAVPRSLGLAGKSAHFLHAGPDGPDYQAWGRELARKEQDALEIRERELEARAEPEQHGQPQKPPTAEWE